MKYQRSCRPWVTCDRRKTIRKLKRLLLCLMWSSMIILFIQDTVFSDTSDYLVGIFGLPLGDFEILKETGLNSILLRAFEVEKAKGLSLNKFYFPGVTTRKLNMGLNYDELDNAIKIFKAAGDAYNYYIGDDLTCRQRDRINDIRNRLGIRKGTVGVKRSVRCYEDLDVFVYYYPLMRTQISLREMLKTQVSQRNKQKSAKGNNFYLFIQAHPQLWYRKVIETAGAGEDALLYPDGQVVRMTVYYAVATGCNGFFLYDWRGLSEKESKERLYAAAQTILETRPLYQSVSYAQGVEFFQKSGDIYGTVVSGSSYDIIFAFTGDVRTLYHPSTKPLQVTMKDLINVSKYKSVYIYSPAGSIPAGDKVEVPQDKALILIAFKDKADIANFTLDANKVNLYLQILQTRAEILARNMEKKGITVPSFKVGSDEPKGKIMSLLNYIDNLNEIKRASWIKKSGNLPMDGDELNNRYWKSVRGAAFLDKSDLKGQVFNFYYDH